VDCLTFFKASFLAVYLRFSGAKRNCGTGRAFARLSGVYAKLDFSGWSCLPQNRRQAKPARGKEARAFVKGSILTAVESRLPYGLNIVNWYFAAFNSLLMSLIRLAIEKLNGLVSYFLEYIREIPDSAS
jgi:hypothetical protein